ncbi:MAG: hypothetical protein CM1200mP20_07660 [Pseudomonadota bacterium]|nr:MAG: hypothetical protein CM1200mP20_07660 [Pseudomonadota bacterium]
MRGADQCPRSHRNAQETPFGFFGLLGIPVGPGRPLRMSHCTGECIRSPHITALAPFEASEIDTWPGVWPGVGDNQTSSSRA